MDIMQENMTEGLKDFHLPRYKEITDVGLYLEQTVKLINTALAPLGEPSLTTSMVSNYVKQKLVANPVKKQYYVDHIAVLFFIALSKNAVALEDIRLLLSLLPREKSVCCFYNAFCGEFERQLQQTFGLSAAEEALREEAEPTELWLLVQTMLSAVVRKIYLDRSIAAFRKKQETETLA